MFCLYFPHEAILVLILVLVVDLLVVDLRVNTLSFMYPFATPAVVPLRNTQLP